MPPRRASARTKPSSTLVEAVQNMPLVEPVIPVVAPADPLVKPSVDAEEMERAVDDASERVLSKRKRAQKSAYTDGNSSSSSLSELGSPEPKPAPKKRKPKAAAAKASGPVGDGEVKEEEGEVKPKKATPKKSRIAKDEPVYDEDGNEVVKKKRKPREYPKKVYEIPEVEKKTTTFKGRLGYACLNTVLRSTKPDSIFCSRTCRIASIEDEGMELPKGLALMNVRDLKTMIQWNEDNNIRFMRMSSEMFPFASHAKYGYDLSFADAELREAGDLAKKYGHRLTMHPGQFTQLGSPRKPVIDSSIRELEYQCEIMDRMGLDQDGVMIIHMGGIFGDKEATLERFRENFTTKLKDNVKARLVLENDEICYNVDDLFPLCESLSIPIIFDYHHDWINPSSTPPTELIPRIAETWHKRGIKMKQHLSEPRPGAVSVMERRAHADRCKSLPVGLPDDVDLMIEAKDKEQAVFELYRIYDLAPVIHDNLRPPDPSPSMQTKGRKSNLKKKTKSTGEVDPTTGSPILLSDIEKEGDGGVGDEGIGEDGEVVPAADDPGMEVGEGEKGKGKAKGAKAKGGRGKKVKEEVVAEDEESAAPVAAKKKAGRPKKVKAEE
ncbi:UV damage endonuclease UvdE [Cryptococcus sp. DSM 104549]